MALPAQLDISTPAGSAAASTIDNQIRDLKQSIVDMFSIPDATNVTNAVMDVAAGGLQTLIFQDTSGSPSAAGELQRNGAELEFYDGTAARVIALQGQAIDLNGTELILDADGDTSITADTDDTIDIRIGGADDFQFTANTFTVASGSSIVFSGITDLLDMAGSQIDLDADGDTSIHANTDDQIDIEIGGEDDFTFTTNSFNVLAGSDINLSSTSSIIFADGTTERLALSGNVLDLDADDDTSIRATTDDQIDFEVAGALDFSMTSNSFNLNGGSAITCLSGATGLNLDGKGVIQFDDDQDTRMYATTDDVLAVEVGGALDFSFSANAFNALSGSIVTVQSGASLTVADNAPATPAFGTLYKDAIVKAWVHVSVATSTPSIDDDFNVSSITDNGAGDYTVNFATAIGNANYAVYVTPQDVSSTRYIGTFDTKASGSVNVKIANLSGTLTDNIGFSVLVFGSA